MFSLGEKMEFLFGNPFSTPVGQRIGKPQEPFLNLYIWISYSFHLTSFQFKATWFSRVITLSEPENERNV